MENMTEVYCISALCGDGSIDIDRDCIKWEICYGYNIVLKAKNFMWFYYVCV